MTPFPETVSDPESGWLAENESGFLELGFDSLRILVFGSLRILGLDSLRILIVFFQKCMSLGVKIESSSSSVEVPLENSSVYLFLSVGRKMTPFPETVSDP